MAPGLDGVPKYNIVEKNGKHYVQVPEKLAGSSPQILVKRDSNDKRRFVVVGGGLSGLNCSESLRQAGYTGEITIVSADSMVPYDRTQLSKAVAAG